MTAEKRPEHLLRGRNSELLARQWLEAQGLIHITANYHCRYGEIDLLMLDANTLIVCEVRYRASRAFGGALHSVTAAKRRKLRLTTEHFLQQHPQHRHRPIRFDVLAVTTQEQKQTCNWLQQAFFADDA